MNVSRRLLFAMTGASELCGGIATANLNVLQALARLAREVGAPLEILSFLESDGARPQFLPAEVRFRGFAGSRAGFALTLLRRATSSALVCLDHVTLALPLLPLAVSGRVRTVIFTHGSESWRRIRRASRWSFRHARLCLTNSDYTFGRMRVADVRFRGAACPLGLSPLLPLHAEPPARPEAALRLRAADGSEHAIGRRMLLLVGRIDGREGEKGHRCLIRCLPELQREFPDVQLVFPGPGDDGAAIAETACADGVGNAVFVPGKVTVEKLSDLYARCHVFAMPSRQEGFGLVYLEAMNYARPCLGCFDDGAEEVIVDGETGILVRRPDDRDELTSTLATLLRDDALARRLGLNGFARLHRRFTARHYQDRIMQHLRPLLSCS